MSEEVRCAVGIDFGTESARAVLVDVSTGEVLARAAHQYAHGVIDGQLPETEVKLGRDWALQDPSDWLSALDATVPVLLSASNVAPGSIVGLGVDFTACTVLPTTVDGTPLCMLERYRSQPHSWPKLWKHHAAQPQADQVNELARTRNEPWLARYGGKISSEWLIPKALQVLEEAPDLYEAAARIVEAGDWIPWQLTGRLARNSCAAGYKATWQKDIGFPSSDFLSALHTALNDLYINKLQGPVFPPGMRVGGLTPVWAERLGLPAGIPVAASIIDAHAAVLGGGISEPHRMLMIMGTSTCHMLMAEEEVLVDGIAGVVEDGIVPGLFGYEAGQAATGDIFAWFLDSALPPAYHEEAANRDVSLHHVLTEKAQALGPGESGLLALDWWNGNRSTLTDADLSGLLIGCTLDTKPEEVYRALIEATAFGTEVIIEAFTEHGVLVENITAGGSLTNNDMLMQIYSDVSGREVAVVGAEQVSALGAAMLGAVAAEGDGGGYDSVSEAVSRMAPPPSTVFKPIPEHEARYKSLYAHYCELYDWFGRGKNDVMKVLRQLRRR